jgi:hypothetical protein
MMWDMRCQIWDERRIEDQGNISSHIDISRHRTKHVGLT